MCFPFAQQLIAVRRVVTKTDGTPVSDATRYWVSSLPPGQFSHERLARLAREYWTVENKNHWKRDVIWGEDRLRVKSPNIARALALVRCALLGPIAAAGYQSLPDAFEIMARNPQHAIALIQNQRLT